MKAGIGRYLQEVLRQRAFCSGALRIDLFAHRPLDWPDCPHTQHIAERKRGLSWYLYQSHRAINGCDLNVFWAAQNLLPLGLSNRLPCVTTLHDCVHKSGLAYAPSWMHHWIHRILIPKTLRQSARILTVSRYVAEEILSYHPTYGSKIEVTPLGVSSAFLREHLNEDEVGAAIKRQGIRQPYVLGLGTLEPRKNLTTLLRAFAQLPGQVRTRYQLVLVGKAGWGVDSLSRQLQRMPSNTQVRLTGYVPDQDLPYLYAGAETFIFPSHYEGFGLPVLEAMAAGCPVISSNGGALPEVVGSAGVMLPSGAAPEEWSRAMLNLLSSREQRQELRAAGLLRARLFSWDKCAEVTFEVIHSLAKSGKNQ
ncbi:MAG: glycosyltransferase family 1 protein [Acidobacteriota bacterium]